MLTEEEIVEELEITNTLLHFVDEEENRNFQEGYKTALLVILGANPSAQKTNLKATGLDFSRIAEILEK